MLQVFFAMVNILHELSAKHCMPQSVTDVATVDLIGLDCDLLSAFITDFVYMAFLRT